MSSKTSKSMVDDLYRNGGAGHTELSAPVVVIPKGSYEFSVGEYGAPSTQFPEVGDLITLTLDGAVYSGTAKKGVMEGITFIYIGNGFAFGDDTGENYTAIFLASEGIAAVTLHDEMEHQTTTTTHTVELSFAGKTIHPIFPQYMPCVTLETAIDGNTTMSEADSAKFDALAAVGLPSIIKFTLGGGAGAGNVAVWCSCMQGEGHTWFKCYIGSDGVMHTVTFTNVDGMWKGIISHT